MGSYEFIVSSSTSFCTSTMSSTDEMEAMDEACCNNNILGIILSVGRVERMQTYCYFMKVEMLSRDP